MEIKLATDQPLTHLVRKAPASDITEQVVKTKCIWNAPGRGRSATLFRTQYVTLQQILALFSNGKAESIFTWALHMIHHWWCPIVNGAQMSNPSSGVIDVICTVMAWVSFENTPISPGVSKYRNYTIFLINQWAILRLSALLFISQGGVVTIKILFPASLTSSQQRTATQTTTFSHKRTEN